MGIRSGSNDRRRHIALKIDSSERTLGREIPVRKKCRKALQNEILKKTEGKFKANYYAERRGESKKTKYIQLGSSLHG